MTELLTAAQMRAIETAAIESGEVTGLELMERAGRGVVEAIFEEWPELAKTSHRAVILCGPGNNGGDGFVVARLLKEWGWDVEVFLYGNPEKLPPDAKVNYERWSEQGNVLPLAMPSPTAQETELLESVASTTVGKTGPDLIVDALFGTGLGRPINALKMALEQIQINFPAEVDPWWPRCVSIDIPSGICSDSGEIIGKADEAVVGAHLTVSFHARKLGQLLADGPTHVGKLVVKSIGLGSMWTQTVREALANHHSYDFPGARLGRVVASLVSKEWLHPEVIKEGNHKYTHGHALILSGGVGKTGAARLAARGALRIGAGLVTLGVPLSAQMEVASQITALMLSRVDGADGLANVLQDKRLNAVCLGPGLGVDRARELVPVAVRAQHTPNVVLDADALTAYADEPEQLFGMLHKGCVLTPHGGEFARLFPDIAEKLNAVPTQGPAYSKVDATREAAKRAGCVVLFKGPDTVIAAPDGRCSINSAQYERAAPWLATAGSGDVLAGFITGLLARGFDPMRAAETAAWLHVECARSFGPGLIAEDLPEELPKVFRNLGI